MPGPGEYEINDAHRKHKSFSLIGSAFNVCASRFPTKPPKETPGNYKAQDFSFGELLL